jgi:hypothetical protein
MPNLFVVANFKRPFGPKQALQKEGLRGLINFLVGCITGTVECENIKWGYNDTVALGDAAYAGPAAALLTMASSSGAVGGVIAGSTVTVTHATSDTASSTALAAAIRAHAISRIVTATNKLAKLTCASVAAGTTVDICGKKFTALANGVTATVEGQFSVGASDTACGTALAAAINRHSALAGQVRAVSAAGVVYFGLTDNHDPLPFECIQYPSASTITVNVAKPTAGAVTMVIAALPGVQGNEIRCAASGTNVSANTNGTTGLLGGGTGGFVPAFGEEVSP